METINIHYRAHLTDNYQMKTAQQLISKLKVQLGMEKGYSEELEERRIGRLARMAQPLQQVARVGLPAANLFPAAGAQAV